MIHSDEKIQEPLRAALGRLGRLVPTFERRPGQLEMARLWDRTLELGGVLAVEAPTGVGKSLAYLLPALLLRARGSGPVVVSTHTKALQDQLLSRDVPLAVAAIGRALRMTTLKGRASYLCRRRARSRLAQRRLFAGFGFKEDSVDRLERWIEVTQTGELDELKALGIDVPPALAAEIASDPIFCSGSGCDATSGCFAKLARREARKSDVVIVNHALLLSDPGLRSTLIAEAGSLVLDEAHHLERVAREQLGVSLGVSDLTRLAARTDARGGALRLVTRALRKGRHQSALERIVEADAAIRPVLEHAAALARDLGQLLPDGSSSARLTRETDWASVSPAALDQLLAAIGSLARALEAAADAAEGDPQSTLLRPEGADAVEELRVRHATWIEVEQALRAVTRLEERGTAFYLDRDGRGAPRLNRRPLRVGDALRSQLFALCERILLTSATLVSDDDFAPLLASLGLDSDAVETARVASPFPLERQVQSVVLDGPDPKDPEFVERLAATVIGLATSVRRNILVLLTSYQMLDQLAARIRGPLLGSKVRLLAQAPGEAAAPLAREFRAGEGMVLLGAASFWEGVDFPGAGLEVLIIARLPFPVPTDPVVAARSEQIEADGGDAFRDLMLPEAILRFRQGVGRLIRTADDRGVVIVADPRVARSTYGERFLATLPARPMLERSPDAIVDIARAWLVRESVECPA
jgi:ATP-dependent DNA helicase DinG